MMLTRCPGCTTTFRVTPEQVKARHGKVRCGRCQHVFDAIEHLVDAAVAVPAVEDALPPPQPEPAVALPAAETAPSPEADTINAEETIPEPAGDVAEEVAQVAELAAEQGPAPTPAADEENVLLQPSPLSATYGVQQRAMRTPAWPWAIASLLVLGALIAQLMVAFRVELAVKHPSIRPALEMLCEQANCVIELPSDPERISIEASDLHPGKKGGLELTATLRNRAQYAQAWPHLELTLTDGADKPIVRKIIMPAQYLPTSSNEAIGFEANGELAVQLQLDPGNLPAAGYRLYLFYP
jgi:predicted Zn finger-like uncharacterized protein